MTRYPPLPGSTEFPSASNTSALIPGVGLVAAPGLVVVMPGSGAIEWNHSPFATKCQRLDIFHHQHVCGTTSMPLGQLVLPPTRLLLMNSTHAFRDIDVPTS